MTAAVNNTSVSCNGDLGSLDLTVAGGTPPYNYAWDNGAGTSEDPTGLGANTYTVQVTDANGCIATAMATISEPTSLGATVNNINLACNGDTNGSLDLTVTGGTQPYSYNWNNGAGNAEDPTGLGANSYSLCLIHI